MTVWVPTQAMLTQACRELFEFTGAPAAPARSPAESGPVLHCSSKLCWHGLPPQLEGRGSLTCEIKITQEFNFKLQSDLEIIMLYAILMLHLEWLRLSRPQQIKALSFLTILVTFYDNGIQIIKKSTKLNPWASPYNYHLIWNAMNVNHECCMVPQIIDLKYHLGDMRCGEELYQSKRHPVERHQAPCTTESLVCASGIAGCGQDSLPEGSASSI